MSEKHENPSVKFWKIADDVYYVDQDESVALFNRVRDDVLVRMENEPTGHYQLNIRKKRFSKESEMRILQLA